MASYDYSKPIARLWTAQLAHQGSELRPKKSQSPTGGGAKQNTPKKSKICCGQTNAEKRAQIPSRSIFETKLLLSYRTFTSPILFLLGKTVSPIIEPKEPPPSSPPPHHLHKQCCFVPLVNGQNASRQLNKLPPLPPSPRSPIPHASATCRLVTSTRRPGGARLGRPNAPTLPTPTKSNYSSSPRGALGLGPPACLDMMIWSTCTWHFKQPH